MTSQSAIHAGAEQKLVDFEEKWGTKYHLVVESFKCNWLRLTRFFEYPAAIRKVVYTKNIVESFRKQIR
jgi:putative transposase